MDFPMRQTDRNTSVSNHDNVMSLDWESLGRLVRVGTLDAVAMHFAAMGNGARGEDGDFSGLGISARAKASRLDNDMTSARAEAARLANGIGRNGS